jgi:hypothetical protein
MVNRSVSIMALMRKAEPLTFWQERQWQQWVTIGATSMRKRTFPHLLTAGERDEGTIVVVVRRQP